MLPENTQTGGSEYNEAKITTFNGLDRISSALYLESQPQALFYFPFVATPLLFALNVVDDETGAINKRGGFQTYLDNPDGLPVTSLIQFTNYGNTNTVKQLRVSGPNIYVYSYSGNSWGTPVKVLSSGLTLRMRHTYLNGFSHLSNGVDPLMFYDGNNFYDVVNGAVSGTINSQISGSTTTTLTSSINSGTHSFDVGTNILAPEDIGDIIINPGGATQEIHSWVTITGTTVSLYTTDYLSFDHNANELVEVYPYPSPNTTVQVSTNRGLYPYFGFIQIDNEYMQYVGYQVPTGLTGTLSTGGTLTVGTTYYYSISAVDSSGNESFINETEVSITPTTGNQTVDLSWTSNGLGWTYRVYRSTSSNNYPLDSLIGTPSSNTFTDNGITPTAGCPIINIPSYGRGYLSTIASHQVNAPFEVVFGQSGSVPNSPKILANIQNRLWAANTNEEGGSSKIYISASRGDAWDSIDWFLDYISVASSSTSTTTQLDPSSANAIYVDPENGQEITSIEMVGGQVYVTKNQSTYLIALDKFGNPATQTKLSSQYGAPTKEALINIDGNAIALNSFGIVASNGSAPILQSYNITDLVQGIPPANLSNVYGVKYNFKYYFSVGSITTAPWVDPIVGSQTIDNAILVFNYLTNNWFLYTTPFTVNCFEEMYSATDSLGHLDLYAGDTNGNTYIYNDQVFNDGGLDIPIVIQTRYFFFKDPATSKEFNRTTVICENGTNGSIYYSLIGNQAMPYQFIMNLPNYVNRHDFPDNDQMWHGIAYKIVESSSSRFRLTGIIQEFEHTFRIVDNMI